MCYTLWPPEMAPRDSLGARQHSAAGVGAGTLVSGGKRVWGHSNATMLLANAGVSKRTVNMDGWPVPG